MTLTDTQLVLLSGASQRDHRLITLPETLKGGAAKKTISKLISQNFAEEVTVKRDQPHWRTDDNERPIGLKITRAGLAAIGIESEPEPADKPERSKPAKREPEKTAGAEQHNAESAGTATAWAPREGSKQALILSLLSRPEGATIDDLLSATGWLPHTTRAALTGLRKKGYELVKSKRRDGATCYTIEAGSRGTEASLPVPKRPRAEGARK